MFNLSLYLSSALASLFTLVLCIHSFYVLSLSRYLVLSISVLISSHLPLLPVFPIFCFTSSGLYQPVFRPEHWPNDLSPFSPSNWLARPTSPSFSASLSSSAYLPLRELRHRGTRSMLRTAAQKRSLSLRSPTRCVRLIPHIFSPLLSLFFSFLCLSLCLTDTLLLISGSRSWQPLCRVYLLED